MPAGILLALAILAEVVGTIALRDFERWSLRPVRREQNADADALVNQALDGERD